MTTAANTPHRGYRASLWRYLVVFALLGIGAVVFVLLLVLGWFVTRDAAAHSRLLEEIGELKAAALPYDDASLAEYYARGTDPQNVDEWLEVLAALDSSEFSEPAKEFGPWKEGGERVPYSGEPWPPEADTLHFLKVWDELRARAEPLALQDRKVRLPLHFDSVDTNLSILQPVRELARLFKLHAQVMIRNENSAATRDAILSIFGCARAIEGQPYWVSQAVRCAIENIAIEELRCALQADVVDTHDLKLILARIEKRTSLTEAWQITMLGERACGLPLFMDQKKYSQYMRDDDSLVLPWRSRDALAFIEVVEQSLTVPTQELDEFYAATQEFDERIKQETKAASPLELYDTMISRFIAPPVGVLGKAYAENELFARRAMLGIGIRLYEDRHSTLPDRLDQLSEVGLDVSKITQIDGSAFDFRRSEDRAVLWGALVDDPAPVQEQEPTATDSTPADYPSIDPNDIWSRNSVWHFPRGD